MYLDDLRLHTRIRVIERLFIKGYRDRIPRNIIADDPLKLLKEIQYTSY